MRNIIQDASCNANDITSKAASVLWASHKRQRPEKGLKLLSNLFQNEETQETVIFGGGEY